MSGGRRGFTVAELVAVLAVVAVLASMLFPVFARSREATRASFCRANLLNIFVALRIYAADFAGLWPDDPPGLKVLADLRLLDAATLQCPSAPSEGGMWELRREGRGIPHYLYVPGLRYPPLNRKLVVADSRPRHGEVANGLFSDGAIRPLPVSRWLAVIPRDVGEAMGIFPRRHVGGGGRGR